MPTPVYTSPFTGTVVTPTDVSYYALSLTGDTPLYWPSIVNEGLGQVPAARIIDCESAATSYTVASNTTTTLTINNADLTSVFTTGALISFNTAASNSIFVVVSSQYIGVNTVVTFSSSLGAGVTISSVALVYKIALPAANQGTVGADILFRNMGSYAIEITDETGGATVTLPSGIALYFYLSDNTTIAGVWQNVTFGAGTSSADASSLAGYGLAAINGKLATTQNVIDITSTPTINDASRGSTYVWGAGLGTLNLPNIAAITPGWFIGFRNAGTGTLNITPVSPALINKASTVAVNPGDSGFIFYDQSTGDFITVGLSAPSNITFTAETFDVDAIVGDTLSLVAFAPIIQTYISQSTTRTTTLNVILPAITQIYVLVNDTGDNGYDIVFSIVDSSGQTLTLSNGGIATVLSDGTNLFSLTQSSTGTFYAANGSASNPSYAFNLDHHTGMYLVGTSVLGLAAHGTQVINIDATNISAPITTIGGELTATLTLVSGGTF
jgi:hypothetical protein